MRSQLLDICFFLQVCPSYVLTYIRMYVQLLFLVNAFPPKPLDVATANFAGASITWRKDGRNRTEHHLYYSQVIQKLIIEQRFVWPWPWDQGQRSNNVFSYNCISSLTIGCVNFKLYRCIGHRMQRVLGTISCDQGQGHKSNNVFSCKWISSLTLGQSTFKLCSCICLMM